jgi:hypothetical protein
MLDPGEAFKRAIFLSVVLLQESDLPPFCSVRTMNLDYGIISSHSRTFFADGGRSSTVRALDCGSRCWGFESPRPPQFLY